MSKPDTPWMPKVRETKTITLFNEADKGFWAGVIREAVTTFNQKAMNSVKYEIVDEKRKAKAVVKIAGSGKDDPRLGADARQGLARRWAGNRGIEEAEIFLPETPWNTHRNMLMMIMMHELTHCAGLEEHANDGIFMTLPNVDEKGNIFSTRESKKMPPFFLSNKTVMRLRAIW